MAVFRYRCVSLVRAGMAPKTWSLVQSVIHGRCPQKFIWAVVGGADNWDDDPSGLEISECGRDGKPFGA